MDHSRQAPTSKGLQWSGRTDRGRVRPNNEDAFPGVQFDGREVHHLGATGEAWIGHLDFAFAVSDGMGGAIRQLSHDDTHVGWLLRNGKINERQARGHPRRNLLQKALGGGKQFVAPRVGAVAYETGDIFLLCTDGLVEGLYDTHLGEFLRSPESSQPGANPADRLVDESLARNGRDNTTALVIQVV